MRATIFLASAFLASALVFGLTQVSAQPRPESLDPAVAAGAYDDLNCAARYTLAAFVIRPLDSTAAEYYTERAAAAGKRYLEMHPGETEQSYAARVTDSAQDIQQRLATNALTPETLVAEIKSCDRDSDSLAVM